MKEAERVAFHSVFSDAMSFASDLHAMQTRKGTDIPYISHLIGVSSLVLEHGGNVDEAIAALLHDAVEDQGHHYPGGADALRAEIKSRFGAAVLEIVDGCTDSDTDPEQKPPWRARKGTYLHHLESATASVRLVSCADKLHNARAIVSDLRVLGDALFARFNGAKTGTLWYYRGLADVFLRLGPENLSRELDVAVKEMALLAGQSHQPS